MELNLTKNIRITLVFDPYGVCADAGDSVRDVQDELEAFRRIEDLLQRDDRFETVTPKTYIVEAECWEHFQTYRGVSGVAFQEVTPRTRLADRLGQKPPEWLTDRQILDWQLLDRELADGPVEDWPAAVAEWLIPGVSETDSLAVWLEYAAATKTTSCSMNCEPLRQWFRESFVRVAEKAGVPSDIRQWLAEDFEQSDDPKRFASEWLRRRALLPLADFSARNPLRAPGTDLGSPRQRAVTRYIPLVFPLPEAFHAEVCQKMWRTAPASSLERPAWWRGGWMTSGVSISLHLWFS